ncbi:MAG: peptide deformylase [Gemmatimonadota bacterium]
MAMMDIRVLGDPILRREAESVGRVDDDVRRLLDDMLETMYAADGVGLAAPQVGVGRRITVIDIRDPAVGVLELIDPEIVERSDEVERGEEGCLSIPGVQEIVERSARVVVEATDRAGERRRIDGEGLLARALQHEVDHLDGVLFIDRVSPLKRRLLLQKWRKVRPESTTISPGG